MTLQDFLDSKIIEHKENIDSITVKTEKIVKDINNCKDDVGKQLEFTKDLLELKDMIMFHSGCVAAYTDILEECKKSLGNK